MIRLGKDRRTCGTICGTVVSYPFRTTVPWIDLRGTVERFRRRYLGKQMFQAASDGTLEPFERGALAPLSGRSVPGPSLRGTSGTASSSSLAFLRPAAGRSPSLSVGPRKSPNLQTPRGPVRRTGTDFGAEGA
jgi:hypothetical protein